MAILLFWWNSSLLIKWLSYNLIGLGLTPVYDNVKVIVIEKNIQNKHTIDKIIKIELENNETVLLGDQFKFFGH